MTSTRSRPSPEHVAGSNIKARQATRATLLAMLFAFVGAGCDGPAVDAVAYACRVRPDSCGPGFTCIDGLCRAGSGDATTLDTQPEQDLDTQPEQDLDTQPEQDAHPDTPVAATDACESAPCGPNAACADLPDPAPDDASGRTCACEPGFEADSAPASSDAGCVEIDPCAAFPCGSDATCTDRPAPAPGDESGRLCACPPGYVGNAFVACEKQTDPTGCDLSGELCAGACGMGNIECLADDIPSCSTDPGGSDYAPAAEVCDGLDNDCDGELNEGLTNVADSSCSNLGVCQAHRSAIVATCTAEGTWLCDYSDVPGYEAGLETRCDELDNDCDGAVNEDLTFTQPDGAVRNFGTSCDGSDSDDCANGLVGCAAGDVTATICSDTGEPMAELCDGVDNDCDQETDEDFRGTDENRISLSDALAGADNGAFLGDTCGAGACDGGVVVCASTTSLKCSTDPRSPASPSAPTDSCDGVDNDCDGVVDGSYLAGGTVKLQGALLTADNGKVKGASCGAGECAGGIVVCASLTTLACSTDDDSQATDTCNDKDDNCNGITDDAFVATSGTNRKPLAGALLTSDNGKVKGASCGTGNCQGGRVSCASDQTKLVCDSEAQATTEICDGVDNDCDGTRDDGFAYQGKLIGAACDGVGGCGPGVVTCALGSTVVATCSTNPDGAASQAIAERCDTIDNDCDGQTDEGLLYQGSSVGSACDGTGLCGLGTVACNGSGTATCSSNPDGTHSQAGLELCDSLDNDCDGSTDDGCFNPCAPSPCQNGGSCSANGVDYRCSCATGYSGPTCATNVDDCGGHGCGSGACVDGVNAYTCNCPNGSFGDGTTSCTTCTGIANCTTLTCTSAANSICSACAPTYSLSSNRCLKEVEMAEIPAGSYLQGCNSGCGTAAAPQHTVALSRFAIDKTEVTQWAFQACISAGACTTPAPDEFCDWDPDTHPNWPADCITYSSATIYCEWLGKRLPTEAEWEAAARGTDARMNPWGSAPVTCNYANFIDCGGVLSDVGSKPGGASPYGVLDLIGNVHEWVMDVYKADAYLNRDGAIDPLVLTGGNGYYVGRGSNNLMAVGPAPFRWPTGPGATGNFQGFRCAKSLDPDGCDEVDNDHDFVTDEDCDPCDPSPCLNGATCAPSGMEAACDCAPGFTGDTCETALAMALDFTTTNTTSTTINVVGWFFNVSAPVEVTALGLLDLDSDGFGSAQQVGIYNSAGTLLVSVSVPASGARVVASSYAFGSWRVVEVDPPIALAIGTNYQVVATLGGPGNSYAYNVGGITTHASTTFVGSGLAAGPSLGPLTFQGSSSFFGPNFELRPVSP